MMMSTLSPEWDRIDILVDIAQENRKSGKISDALLERLQTQQNNVLELREAGDWNALTDATLSNLEYDILACIIAPLLSPRIAWLYRSLQGQKDKPTASFHFIQELLNLLPKDMPDMFAAIKKGSKLEKLNLIKTDGAGPFTKIEPALKLTQKIFGASNEIVPPPGTHLIESPASWDDLILPRSQMTRLREYLSYIHCRDLIENEWGGRASPGPVALFCGASGTGKTFAASVLANALGWPLFRVDLGRLVSKYIGETEKNLNALFDAAHSQNMILQFDEADALFSKRGEIKDARDRYANMEVSHLLTRIEAHKGPCVLTTNLRDQMDVAFARRFQIVVDFPRPDIEARKRLWKRSLPPRAPMDDNMDFGLVAQSVRLNGGSIRNAAHHSAVMAAHAEEALGLKHISQAVWCELSKEGRPLSHSEIGDLAPFLEKGTA